MILPPPCFTDEVLVSECNSFCPFVINHFHRKVSLCLISFSLKGVVEFIWRAVVSSGLLPLPLFLFSFFLIGET